MKYTVSKRFSFEAAHSLPYLPVGHKCRNLHGHSYAIEVACSRCALDKNGFVIDYADISAIVDPLIATLDHRNLNDLFEFKTTAEHLAAWFFREIEKQIKRGKTILVLDWVKVYETAKTCVRVEN